MDGSKYTFQPVSWLKTRTQTTIGHFFFFSFFYRSIINPAIKPLIWLQRVKYSKIYIFIPGSHDFLNTQALHKHEQGWGCMVPRLPLLSRSEIGDNDHTRDMQIAHYTFLNGLHHTSKRKGELCPLKFERGSIIV